MHQLNIRKHSVRFLCARSASPQPRPLLMWVSPEVWEDGRNASCDPRVSVSDRRLPPKREVTRVADVQRAPLCWEETPKSPTC